MRQETRHHSDEQIRDALTFARDLVDELAIPDDLRVQAFTAACNLRTAKQITETQAVPVGMPTMAMPRNQRGAR